MAHAPHRRFAVAHLWHRACRGLFIHVANAWARVFARRWDSTLRLLWVTILDQALLPVVTRLVPPTTRVAWHRHRYHEVFARTQQGPGPVPDTLPPSGEDPVAYTRLVLGSRLPSENLVEALRGARNAGVFPEPVFRRAVTRLSRGADGQVAPAAGISWQSEATRMGYHNQHRLGDELARWAAGRAAWRRDPSLRLLVTDPSFSAETAAHAEQPLRRVLSAALDGIAATRSPRERAMALTDALTWPEFLIAGFSVLPVITQATDEGRLPQEVLQALSPDDVGALLASPRAEVRAWTLTTVLPMTCRAAPGTDDARREDPEDRRRDPAVTGPRSAASPSSNAVRAPDARPLTGPTSPARTR